MRISAHEDEFAALPPGRSGEQGVHSETVRFSSRLGAGSEPQRLLRSVAAFILHAMLIGSGVAWGAWRYATLQQDRELPTPRVEPVSIAPRHHRPDLVDQATAQRILVRLQPRLRNKPAINHVDHALRLWGAASEFEDPESLSGVELRALLLDHRAFSTAWGPAQKPLLMPDTRDPHGVAFRTAIGRAAASHVDHTLAGLAEVGTPLDFPVITPQGERTVRDALRQSLESFSLNQEEYEWSTLAYLLYLPHVKIWTSREGQRITWDRLAERLMRQRLAQGVCFGQHRLYTLAALLIVDESHGLLSTPMRARVIAHLQDATNRLVATQNAEGYWDNTWSGDEWDGPVSPAVGPLGSLADRILATGHAVEWWAYAPKEALPTDDGLSRATRWLIIQLDALTDAQVREYYPFVTHAGRALALWSGTTP